MVAHFKCHFNWEMFKTQTLQQTRVFAVFEGPESVMNLHTALDMYKEQVDSITKTMWRQDLQTTKLKLKSYVNLSTGEEGMHVCVWRL